MVGMNLTLKELELLCAFVKNCKSEVNWTAVAEQANCSSAKYARDRFAAVRNKLFAGADDGREEVPDSGGKAKGSKNTPGRDKSKRKTFSEGDDIAPTKKKAKKSKAEDILKSEADSLFDGDGGVDDKQFDVKEEHDNDDEMPF